ncbi:MAG: SURF1 family protein [Parvibaculum sp.]|uniref:SURF1 family protein n=1 Tax=Parvibaculum sp. TaxID=2024848 RepID=UPI0032676837
MSLSANRFFRPLLWPTLMTLAALPVLIGLGVWQLERLEWKEALLERIETRLAAAPVELPEPREWSALDVAAHEYARVTLTGRFLDREFHYFTQGAQGQAGYAVISPLEVEAGAVVLVDRGFVPAALKETDAHGGVPQGEVSFTGILRAPHARGTFDGVDDPEKNIWMVRDPAVMGAALDGMTVAPFIVEAGESAFAGEWPKAGAARVDIPNNHLDYALTWFGLAAVLVAIYFLYHRSNRRIGREKP